MRSLITAQEQFRAQCVVDQDGDTTGEYGWLGELAKTNGTRVLTVGGGGPFIAPILGVKDTGGRSQKSGYTYALYLPTASGAARAEPAGADVAVAADALKQSKRWICYAWPTARGQSGNRTFVATQAGEVYATTGGGPGQQYSGTTCVPRPDAALDVSGPNPKNLDAPVAGAAAGAVAGDGGTWVPAGN